MEEQRGEQGRPSQKCEGLDRMAASVWCCLVVVAVLVGEGEEARRVEVRPGISRFNVGQDFFNLGVEGFGGVGCRGKVHHSSHRQS